MNKVYFCKEPDGGELAVMVDQMNGSKVTVYAHDGQHSEADVEYVKSLPVLENPEQSALYKELQSQGYENIEAVPSLSDLAATESPVDECTSKSVSDVIESVIGGSPICESAKRIANILFESIDYTNPNYVYNELAERQLFTDSELELVTNGWGLNMDTLDRICQVRYAMDADQVLEEN